jgi:carboxyl-terminal processing protease
MDYYEQGYDDIDPNADKDSTSSKPIFYTNSGRKVFGGGGITPDVTIKSKKITKFTSNLISNRVFFDFAAQYANKRPELSSSFNEFYKKFHIDDTILNQFRKYISDKEIDMEEEDFKKDIEFIKLLIKSELARNIWDSKSYYQIRMAGDHQVREALKLFPQAAKIASISSTGLN